MEFCRNCGTKLNDGTKFCPSCGQTVDGSASASTPAAGKFYYQNNNEDAIKTWQKIVCVLVWPAGAILTIIAFIKKQTALAKSALIYTIIGIVLSIAFTAIFGDSDTDMLEKEVKKMIVEKARDSGQKLVISDFSLVHQSGNNYIGIAVCTLDGKKMELDVNVVYDGSKFQAEWAPTAEYQMKEFEEDWNELFDN